MVAMLVGLWGPCWRLMVGFVLGPDGRCLIGQLLWQGVFVAAVFAWWMELFMVDSNDGAVAVWAATI